MNCQEIQLTEVIKDIAAGPFGSNLKVSCFVNEGFPIVDGANLKRFKVTDNITKFVTEEKARSLHRSIAKRGDVIVTISGTLGQISYIPNNSKYEEYLCSQRQFRVTFDTTKVYVPYLVFYFHTYEGQHKILSFANQVGVPALSQPLKNFRQITVQLPDIKTQKKIANIVEVLNEKIEENENINNNLEAQAQALMLDYCDKVHDTAPLGTVMSFINGFAFRSSTYLSNGEYRIITIKNVQDGRVDAQGASFIDAVPTQMKPECNLQIGDVLLSLTGNVGRVGIVCEDNLLLNQRVAKFQPFDRRNLPFLYFYYRLPETKVRLETIAKGTAQANLSPVETLKLEFPFDQSLMSELSDSLSGMFSIIENNQIQNLALAETRDTLLPRLMSGELDVFNLDL